MVELEVWGGVECTVNRVGDHYTDQVQATGHEGRDGDLPLLAELGIKALRFPVLWERVSPESPDQHDWTWSDARLTQLRGLGIRPIVGLIHHGSGPRYTSLIDEGFAEGLAAHALATAQRYPWVEDWTPVNEPLTTARFSALYGHWYPHTRDEGSFWLALLNQIDGVRLSMRAIRSVNPKARLIQTDDLGRTYATMAVADQAAFDNVRRWMGWDLLCGRVVPGHDLYERLCTFGLAPRLQAIAADPCPPDIVGINHYLTSDRFLDHRLQRYPDRTRGGNEDRPFADSEAVRVLTPPPPGLRGAIVEAWERYGLPIAVTEVHNGCTREEQLRWTRDAWEAAQAARRNGIDVRAITAWALFGSQGWNTLLTAPGLYEPGVFDVSGGTPRPTALAQLIKSLSRQEELEPAVRGAGWWQRDIRLHHATVARAAPVSEHRSTWRFPEMAPPLLICGATGTLGQALAATCRHRDLHHVLTGRGDLDLSDPQSIAAALDLYKPWGVANAAGWVRVDDAEGERDGCIAANATGAVALARACSERGIPTVNVSSDLVFDGAKPGGYFEDDAPAPLCVYGESKAMMEAAVLALPGAHLIVRTAAFFSPYDPYNFAFAAAQALARGERFAAAEDQEVTPAYVPDLCNAILDLLIDGETGIWHLSNGAAMSWADFGRRVAEACQLDPALIDPVPGASLGWRAPRPPSCALLSRRGTAMHSMDSALARFAEHIRLPVSAG